MTAAWHRVFWTADVLRPAEGGTWVDIRRGALHISISQRNLGEHRYVRPDDVLEVEVGDMFIVCGPSIDETMMGRVAEVDGCRVRVELSDELAEDTTTVQITEYRGRAKRSRKKAA